MSAHCRKIVITVEVPDCCPDTDGGPGSERPPQPVPTPFLVIPCRPGDPGTRPITTSLALDNRAIQAGIASLHRVDHGGISSITKIQLSCVVANLGAVASAAAMIEFYTGAAIGIWSPGHDTLTPAQVRSSVQLVGRVSATIPPGSAVTVNCPRYWVPGSVDAAKQGVLVQVRDLLLDPVTAAFDAVNDRHVARFDAVMDPIIS